MKQASVLVVTYRNVYQSPHGLEMITTTITGNANEAIVPYLMAVCETTNDSVLYTLGTGLLDCSMEDLLTLPGV